MFCQYLLVCAFILICFSLLAENQGLKRMSVVLDVSWKSLEELSSDLVPSCFGKRMKHISDGCKQSSNNENSGKSVAEIDASHNRIKVIGDDFLHTYHNLFRLNISNNCLSELPAQLWQLKNLKELFVTNNRLSNLPKSFEELSLEVLNMSGNMFKDFPVELCEMESLTTLLLGGNRFREIPSQIAKLQRLEVLYLGGNSIRNIPDEIGQMSSLCSLSLCDNQLVAIPVSLANLKNLHSLSVHNNYLEYLPKEVLSLVSLAELSLRGNPLVARFVRDLTYDPPTLFELASRQVRSNGIHYSEEQLPSFLVRHLNTARKCPNPKCSGVYFEPQYEQIKFVDFCGKYRLPLMQYLCSPECISSASASAASSEYETEDEEEVSPAIMRRVLLG